MCIVFLVLCFHLVWKKCQFNHDHPTKIHLTIPPIQGILLLAAAHSLAAHLPKGRNFGEENDTTSCN